MSLREEDAAIWHRMQVLPSELGLVLLACLNSRVAYTHQPSLIIDHFGLPSDGPGLERRFMSSVDAHESKAQYRPMIGEPIFAEEGGGGG